MQKSCQNCKKDFECRHQNRMKKRNPRKLWPRACACLSAEALAKVDAYKNSTKHFHGDAPCQNEFETSYSPDRQETVFCEHCYQQEVA